MKSGLTILKLSECRGDAIILEAINVLGHVILRATKLEDILSVEQIQSLAQIGYTFRVNGNSVPADKVYTEAVSAAIREGANNV